MQTQMHTDFLAWLDRHKGRQYDLHDEHLNPVFVKMLRAIGFDKGYVRGEGCYLWDAEGNQYLDLLTGWGVFALGRNHPKVRAILQQLIGRTLIQQQIGKEDATAALPSDQEVRARASDIRKDLPACVTTARSHGISLVTIWQDLAQIRSIYGDLGNAIFNNHKAKVFGSGISDPSTLPWLEHTRRAAMGAWAHWSPGRLDDRCFTLPW